MKEILKHFFDPTPGSNITELPVLIFIFLASILWGIGYKTYLKHHKKNKALKIMMKKLPTRLITIGIVGFIYLFARSENLPYLSMPIIVALIMLILVWIVGKAVYQMKKVYPRQMSDGLQRIASQKYLPQRKRKK